MTTLCLGQQVLHWQDTWRPEPLRLAGLELLQACTKIYLEIAKFYVGDNKVAIRARQKVERKSRGQYRNATFHATLLSRLAFLDGILDQYLHESDIGYSECAAIVEETLRVFNDVVSDVDEPTSIQYPGLHSLIDEHNIDKTDSRKPKPLGHRICLFCPSNLLQDLLVEQVLRCSDALGAEINTANHGTRMEVGSILADIAPLQEWRAPEGTTASAERLHDTIAQLPDCNCGHRHDLLKASFLSPGSRAKLFQHLLCVPATSTQPYYWYVSQLDVVERPEDEQVSSEKTNKVRFVDVEPTQTAPQSTVWRTYRTMCNVMKSAGPVKKLFVDKNGALGAHVSDDDHLDQVPVQLDSLQSLMSGSKALSFSHVSKKERIILGVVLSYTYLYLSDTAWWPNKEVRPDFWFKRNTASNGMRMRRPLLSVGIRETDRAIAYSVEAFMNKQRPSLPAFGKLLLELWKGTNIEWKDLDAAIQECAEDYVGSYWLCAVHACLGEDPAMKEAGSIRDSPRLRSVFVHKVIKSLQWLLENLCRISVNEVLKFDDDHDANPSLASRMRVEPRQQHRKTTELQVTAPKPRSSGGPKRLINSSTLELELFSGWWQWPDYAILSHRWTMAEVTLSDWTHDNKEHKLGWSKIKGACRRAAQDGIPYLWVDSCCIDKSSSAELNEALNSMFRWYRLAKVCYVYLSDIERTCQLRDSDLPYPNGSIGDRMVSVLSCSEWFTRGWTLQELLAPSYVEFFDASWYHIGKLGDIAAIISQITSIDAELLLGRKNMKDYSVAQRFAWASKRRTSREEDEAYCLIGIFDVSLDARYGIGGLAFQELQKAILHSGRADDSLFAWNSLDNREQHKLFANSPADYTGCADVVCVEPRLLKTSLSCRSDGVGGRIGLYRCQTHLGECDGFVAVLNCTRTYQSNSLLALRLTAATESSASEESSDFAVTASMERAGGRLASSPHSDRLLLIDKRRLGSVSLTEATITLQEHH
jgi:hypothetical protein